jgi:hypothetical protein
MEMDNFLSQLYGQSALTEGLDKTAEAAMFQDLRETGQAEQGLEHLSMEELIELAKTAGEASDEVDDGDLQKLAFDKVAGETMAHSMIHEFRLIKEAMTQGLCRVCKANGMDMEGASICSACMNIEDAE